VRRGLWLVAKGSIDVASTVQHSHDIDAAIDRRVDDDVSPEREAAYIGGQLVPRPAHQRLCRDELELLVQLVDPPIDLIQAVFSDVIPDVEDVGRPPAADG